MEAYQKLNNNEGIEKLEFDELGNVAGGFATVSDPIYSLTSREEAVLKGMGLNLEKTRSGIFRVKYSNNTTIEPHVLSWMCKTIDETSKRRYQ